MEILEPQLESEVTPLPGDPRNMDLLVRRVVEGRGGDMSRIASLMIKHILDEQLRAIRASGASALEAA